MSEHGISPVLFRILSPSFSVSVQLKESQQHVVVMGCLLTSGVTFRIVHTLTSLKDCNFVVVVVVVVEPLNQPEVMMTFLLV